MKKICFPALMAVVTVILSGCISYSYEGETLPPTESVTIYSEKSKIPCEYQVMGNAVASGYYQDVTLGALKAEMEANAAKCGADAVLITSVQVVPDGEAVRVDPAVKTMSATGAENTYNMNQIQKDFDSGYGQAFDKNPPRSGVREYRRILKAEFIKFKK